MKRGTLIASIPHSGEEIPEEAFWLKGLKEEILMYDVDRFVHLLYGLGLKTLGIPHLIATWHRYCADLNRCPEDVDAGTVQGSENSVGTFSRGFIWAKTTRGDELLSQPISTTLHRQLVDKCYEPFHKKLRALAVSPTKVVYHLDLHSMPSVGTSEHRDPGERRADFVISNQLGQSCDPEFFELVCEAFHREGFKVRRNWPYMGGRITERYGKPASGHHTVQVEMNRSLYMDETTKKLKQDKLESNAKFLSHSLKHIQEGCVP